MLEPDSERPAGRCEPRVRYCPGGAPGQPRWGTGAQAAGWRDLDERYGRVIRPYRREPLAPPHLSRCPEGCPHFGREG